MKINRRRYRVYQWSDSLAQDFMPDLFFLDETGGRSLPCLRSPIFVSFDGMLDLIISDIIEAGVDALHPIELKYMDIVKIKRQYGAYPISLS